MVRRLTNTPPTTVWFRAFSLVEMVLVVVIIGIIAAIAIPRMTQGSARARATALVETIDAVERAIDYYYAEHGRYPGYDPDTDAASDEMFVKQLLQYTDREGNVAASPSATYLYGPYLQRPFPTNPFNELATVKVKANHTGGTVASTGWIAYLDDGEFEINATETQLESIYTKDLKDVSVKNRFSLESD